MCIDLNRAMICMPGRGWVQGFMAETAWKGLQAPCSYCVLRCRSAEGLSLAGQAALGICCCLLVQLQAGTNIVLES